MSEKKEKTPKSIKIARYSCFALAALIYYCGFYQTACLVGIGGLFFCEPVYLFKF